MLDRLPGDRGRARRRVLSPRPPVASRQFAFLHRLASRARLIVMDQRGVGLSDGAGTIPTIDERVADMAAVADAAGTERMFVIGHCHGGPPSAVYAATHPERVA